MSFLDTLKSIEASVSTGSMATLANEVMDIAAVAVPEAAPVIASIKAVENVVVGVLNAADQTVSTVVAATTTAAPEASSVSDPASVAAANISAAESATPDQIVSRITALEQGLVSLMPLFQKIVKEMGM